MFPHFMLTLPLLSVSKATLPWNDFKRYHVYKYYEIGSSLRWQTTEKSATLVLEAKRGGSEFKSDLFPPTGDLE